MRVRVVRVVAAVVVASVALSVLTLVPAGPAGASAVTERTVYGRNEAVILELAQITYTPSCPTGGVQDWIYPYADIYVVKGSAEPSGALSDASGEPNTVIGVTGGGVFGEIIGYTKPAGALGPGTYSIAIDECQDGQLGAEDSFVPDAFRVVSDVVGPELPDIGSLKANAALQATRYEHAVLLWKALLALSEKGGGSAGKAYGYVKKILFGVGLPNPADIATLALGNKGKHYAGIAADPPDPAFDQATVLAPTAVPPVVDPTDPMQNLAAEAVGPLTTSAALAEGLLRSYERYQGAWAARDGEWQLAHARAVQAYAALLAEQAPADVAALDALADDVDALPTGLDATAAATVAQIDSFLTSGPTAEERADLANQGVTESEMRTVLPALRAELDGFAVGDLATDLRDLADDTSAGVADLEALAADMQDVIDELAADPFVEGTVPVVDAGGPYSASVGASLDLAGVATGPDPLTFEWDLDGDAQFDDATGATPTVSPSTAYDGLAGLRVTTASGEAAVAYAPLTVAGGPAGPTLDDPLPATREVDVALGSTESFSVGIGGDGPSATWHLDGVEVGAGADFDFTPTVGQVGPHLLDVDVVDASGQHRTHTWYVSVTAPDGDSDQYWSHIDCDDTVASTFPGAPELLDGVDNDCDPASPDGGVAPVVNAGAALAGTEGTSLALSRGFTHPSGTYTATVDWGDGTVVPATVSGKTVSSNHTYTDDGDFRVEICVTATLGKTGCAATVATIGNEPAGPRFSTLFDWTIEEYDPGNGNWTVAPDGLSVFQSINGDPTFFLSDQPVPPGIEAGVTLAVETTGDNDFVGFVLGAQPGFTDDPAAEYLILDWKQGNQSGGGCNDDSLAEEGLAVIRVTGIPSYSELWPHTDCPSTPDATVTEIARATNLGATGWDDNTQYRFRIQLTEDTLQIWVDDVLEFDLTGDFPLGHLGFYNYSQSSVRYSGYQLVPGDVVEGTPREYAVSFDDPGTADTHTGTITWGDGTPDDLLVIDEADGEGVGVKTHQYLEDGFYDGEVCVTDDDEGTACQQFPIFVDNAPPVVDAGRDRVSGVDLALDDSIFDDPGVLDTHTATVDWGDGSGAEEATVAEVAGEGIVTAGHTYGTDGIYPVEVCVTDDEGGVGCDAFDVDVRIANQPPVAETDPDLEVTEGDVVTRGVGFTDDNPDDTHTASIDWGDGTVEELDLVENGSIGSGGAAHQYPDDGVFPVSIEVCDDGPACVEADSTVNVVNAPPIVEATGGPVGAATARRSEPMEVAAAFTDVGVEDTHTATIDWGDGAGPIAVPVEQGEGSGSVEATHTYDAPGDFEVEVCVTDDDGGAACDAVALTAAGQVPGPPLDVSAIGGDGDARVRWDPPLDDGGSPLLQYEIETTPGGATTLLIADQLSAIVEGLSNDTDYTFRVRASNEYGFGPWSEPSNLTRPRPSCPGAIFDDVGADNPFCPEIKWMGDTGVSLGWPDNTYRPVQPVTRQAMAAFSYRLLNPGVPAPPCTSKPFVDVDVTDQFCAEIAWMKAEGISTGDDDGMFRAVAPVSRQAMAAFLYRLTDSPNGDDPTCATDEFSDVLAGDLFCGEIDWMVDIGVTGGFEDGSFRPTQAVARQSMAAFIFRYNILTGFIE